MQKIRNLGNIGRATLAILNTTDYIMTLVNKIIVQIMKVFNSVWGCSVPWLLTV